MMVIFLVGLVSMILMRTLRKDYARYSKEDELDDLVSAAPSTQRESLSEPPPQERDLGDEYGWKQVHGDVFRPPELSILFTSVIGSGHQLAVVALGCILIALVEHLYTE